MKRVVLSHLLFILFCLNAFGQDGVPAVVERYRVPFATLDVAFHGADTCVIVESNIQTFEGGCASINHERPSQESEWRFIHCDDVDFYTQVHLFNGRNGYVAGSNNGFGSFIRKISTDPESGRVNVSDRINIADFLKPIHPGINSGYIMPFGNNRVLAQSKVQDTTIFSKGDDGLESWSEAFRVVDSLSIPMESDPRYYERLRVRVEMISPDTGYRLEIHNNQYILYMTTNGGQTWPEISRPPLDLRNQTFHNYDKRFFYFDRYGVIFINDVLKYWVSNDFGKTWSSHSFPDEHPYSRFFGIRDVKFINKYAGFLIGFSDDDLLGYKGYHILYTRNGGKTWNQVRNELSGEYTTVDSRSLIIPAPGLVYALGYNSLYEIDLRGIDSLRSDAKPPTDGFSIRPNPALDSVSLKSEDSGTVYIHDLTGRLIWQQVLAPGETTVDVADWPAGVYVCRFTAASRTQTRKLVKL